MWRRVMVVAGLLPVAGWLVWVLLPPVGPEDTYAMAQGRFQSIVQREGWKEEDFQPPPPVPPDAPLLLTLEWRSRKVPMCGIEVDLDRMYAGARPRTFCRGASGATLDYDRTQTLMAAHR